MSEIDGATEVGRQSLALLSKVERSLHQLPESNHIVVAYSGGLDSSVLLRMLSRIDKGLSSRIQVVHVHHGVSAHADEWVEHCRTQSKALGFECIIEYAVIDMNKGSFEDAARKARYSIFEKYMAAGALLLTAHHADDQIETVLMRLMRRGHASLKEGIPYTRSFSGGLIVRPFLSISRQELHQSAVALGLSWVEDESNQDTSIERNRLRHDVLPRVRELDSAIGSRLLSIASNHAQINMYRKRMFESASEHLFSSERSLCLMDKGVSLSVLGKLSREAQRIWVRDWIKSRELPQPSLPIFDRIWSELIPARADADPIVQWGSVCVRRWRSYLYLIDLSQIVDVSVSAELDDCVRVNSGWAFSLEQPENGVVMPIAFGAVSDISHSSAAPLRLESYANVSSRTKIFGKSKKQWLSVSGIPPWRRGAIVFVMDDSCGAVLQLVDLQSLSPLVSIKEDASASGACIWLSRL
jgi:tRNA(Ile)-lysidine synthase